MDLVRIIRLNLIQNKTLKMDLLRKIELNLIQNKKHLPPRFSATEKRF